MNRVQRKQCGAFYTPGDVARCLVRWAVRRQEDRLLDPSCGDGRFLAEHRNSVGVERERTAAALARPRAHAAAVHEADFFTWAEATQERFECAAGNPPFIRYQSFAGKVRANALSLCRRLGVRVSALTSSWVPFLIVTASLLKPGGRMAFVVPAEIGHAPYAAPLIWYLTGNFRRVQIVALLRKLFPQLSEDAWLLFADGYRESTEDLLVTKLEQFEFLEEPPAEGTEVTLSEWQRWGCRLRPFLLQSGVRGLYEELAVHLQTSRLGAVARASVGYVTGANEFFHLRPSAAREAGIPERFLCPTVRNARCLPPNVLTKETVECWLRRDDPVLLLRLSSHEKPPRAVQEYLDSPAGREARESYKCRNRHPWYAVPDVTFPDAFLSYMSGEGPSLVANVARCACTNSLHAVQMKNGASVSDLQASWSHPLTRLSCELEGHPLGGGMLKLEPREAARLVIPRRDLALTRRELRCIEEGIAELRRWRHYE